MLDLHFLNLLSSIYTKFGQSLGPPSMIQSGTYFVPQLHVKYTKIILIFHLRQAAFVHAYRILHSLVLHVSGGFFKSLGYRYLSNTKL